MKNFGLDELCWNQDFWEKYQQPEICILLLMAESEEEEVMFP